jgi:methionine synthase II (cobalamin-independent)
MTKIKGLATGIGSLPHKDAQSALDLIFKYCPQIPFWPQLPKRGVREGMVAQFSQNLPCLEVGSQGLFFNPADKEKKLEAFYERIIANDIEYFGINEDYALGFHAFRKRLENSNLKNIEFIKAHLTGPFTFAAGLKDENGVSLLHDEVFMQAILKGLGMKALWQINILRSFNKKIIIFLDEPYLGCFGSAYTPINREDVIKGLSDLAESIKSQDVLLGAHCCGNTDWSIFTDIPGIDIISFDAFSYLDKLLLYADNLSGFFKRDGILCWGIVPTAEFSGRETPDSLVKIISIATDTLSRKGLDKDLLLGNLLISPACGLGTLDVSKSQGIFALLSETSALIKKI